jgi:hypothetical protein
MFTLMYVVEHFKMVIGQRDINSFGVKPFWHSKINVPALLPLKLTVPITSSLGYASFQGREFLLIYITSASCRTK